MSAPEIVTSAGSALANSYCDIDDADAYHDTHLYGSAWFAADVESQTKGLIWATRLLDQHFEWNGSVASSDQALRWPRAATYDHDGRLLANDEIPEVVVNATAELARALITADRTSSDTQTGAIQYVTVGNIAIKYSTATAILQTVIPDAVKSMLAHLGTYTSGGTGSGSVTLRRA